MCQHLLLLQQAQQSLRKKKKVRCNAVINVNCLFSACLIYNKLNNLIIMMKCPLKKKKKSEKKRKKKIGNSYFKLIHNKWTCKLMHKIQHKPFLFHINFTLSALKKLLLARTEAGLSKFGCLNSRTYDGAPWWDKNRCLVMYQQFIFLFAQKNSQQLKFLNLMFLTVQNVQNSETKHSTPTFEPGT